MKEWELGGVEAGTGVNIGFDNVVIERSAETSTFFPNYDPDKNVDEQTEYISFRDMSGKQTYNGDLSIVVGAYEAPQRGWFIKDTAKLRKGSAGLGNVDYLFKHKKADYEILSPLGNDVPVLSDAERRGIDVVTLTMGNGTDAFMTRDSSMGLRFSADGFVNSSPEDPWLDSGTLAITDMITYGQQVTIYPINEIPEYASGEGIALEIRSKTSIDKIKLTAPDGTENALVSGVHMRESFNQDVHSQYGKWGNMKKNYFDSDAPSEYFDSTFDPDGFYAYEWDPQDTPLDRNLINTPYSGEPGFFNMYDGFMLNGNINQIAFYDRIAGKKLALEHGQQTDCDVITGDDFSDSSKLDQDFQVHNQTMANNLAIEERPMTIQVKTGRSYSRYDDEGNEYEHYDDRSYVAINWPRHGSVRVEEIKGFFSQDDDYYNAFTASLGSVILDGMRAKKTYIEFPGRMEQYRITEQNSYVYVYDAGRLPDGINQTCLDDNGDWKRPPGQADWDPIGRGQLDFLSKLGKSPGGTGAGVDRRWEIYDIKKTMPDGVSYDFWHIYEPDYPGAGANWIPDH